MRYNNGVEKMIISHKGIVRTISRSKNTLKQVFKFSKADKIRYDVMPIALKARVKKLFATTLPINLINRKSLKTRGFPTFLLSEEKYGYFTVLVNPTPPKNTMSP